MMDSDSFWSTRTISSSVTGGRCFDNSWTAFIISAVDTIMFPFWKRCFLFFRNLEDSFSTPGGSVKTPPMVFYSWVNMLVSYIALSYTFLTIRKTHVSRNLKPTMCTNNIFYIVQRVYILPCHYVNREIF